MKIGLALGGGGARGIAHLGVWQRLQELGIPIHCIAGTSIGAIAGAGSGCRSWESRFTASRAPRSARSRAR